MSAKQQLAELIDSLPESDSLEEAFEQLYLAFKQAAASQAAASPAASPRAVRLRRFLEAELWPVVPPEELGRRLSRNIED